MTAAGVSAEISQKLAKAIVENESESIVTAIKDAIIANTKNIEAKVRREILEKGSPSGVNVSSGSTAEKPDENMELVNSHKNALFNGSFYQRNKRHFQNSRKRLSLSYKQSG